MGEINMRVIYLLVLLFFSANAYSQPATFPCDDSFYFVFGQQGQLFTYDALSEEITIAPFNAGESINALGYREADNLGYAISSNGTRLIQVAADGSTVDRGVVNGLPGGISYPAGSFGPDDFLYVYRGDGPDPNRIFVIDVDAVEVVNTIDIAGPTFVIADLAYSQRDGVFYSVTGNYEGLEGTFVLISIDINTQTTSVIGPVVASPVLTAAIFADASGNIYSGSTRNAGTFSIVDSETGLATIIGNVAMADQDGGVDGFFCGASSGTFCQVCSYTI